MIAKVLRREDVEVIVRKELGPALGASLGTYLTLFNGYLVKHNVILVQLPPGVNGNVIDTIEVEPAEPDTQCDYTRWSRSQQERVRCTQSAGHRGAHVWPD